MIPGKLNQRLFWLLLLTLVGLTAVVFAPVASFDATNYDDPHYVFQNPMVQNGLSGEAVGWAFTTGHMSNWHPVTWLSHQADVELFGLNAGAHHVVNLVLHCANVALVFVLFCGLTDSIWRSASVAALFGLHPLHVESVAWIAERKDVLSAFFGLLALLAYRRFVQTVKTGGPKLEKPPPTLGFRSLTSGYYWLALVFFALGLMSKPMLVTLPLLMLLLDLWPLNRVASAMPRAKIWRHLLAEKIPFLLLTAASCVITLLVQGKGGAVQSLENWTFGDRLANAITATVLYLAKTFWPAKLAPFYPLPERIPLAATAGAFVLLIGLTTWALWSARRAPCRALGWFWFLITLVPVIGLVQVGMQQMADRYTYLPLVGVFALIAWEAADITRRVPALRPAFAAGAVALIAACASATRQQVLHWRDSGTLFTHALAVTEKNYLAHNNLGYHLFTQGNVAEAVAEYEAALQINPAYTDAHSNLGRALAEQQRYDEAVGHFQAVLRILRQDVIAHNNLGNALAILGRHEEAIEHFRIALAAKPDHAPAHNNWALSAEALGRAAEAIEHYREALRLAPGFYAALNNLAWLLATHPDDDLRNGGEAMQFAERACRATDCSQPVPLLTLAAASAESGQLEAATLLATQALELARAANHEAATKRATEMLEAFRNGRPFRAAPGQ